MTWKTKKLKWICTSSSEAEYLAFYYGCKQAIKTGRLIKDVFGKNIFPIKVFTDNQAVLDVIARRVPSDLNLHLSTKYLAPIQWSEHGLILPIYVKTNKNPADGMTKIPKNFGAFLERVLSLRGSVEKQQDMKSGLLGILEDNNVLEESGKYGKVIVLEKEQNRRM